ncbi:TetR/AcrR family transcriptional regulator [Micromonospora sp. WMMD1102]|uniref:TetR/AcrR family transcriptional regulator n=1 Tax=Micromonospora sp. WMMD1102 TaxID=3016105 RepID=UPI0024150F5F|nr:TetR/AcrR family transcriptional regulator [Micromonospora sp. WMMD1102]MDG4785313.1 TetR/AcrR family transcriptional regulator [Micromonospora sp. WMMD1102]
MSAPGVRARIRAELTEEIKSVAHRHLATDGANLSLRAVARDLGMAPSAVYRYFASRDDLLTALIIDAYNAVGDAAERALPDAPDPLERWLAVSSAVRAWALAEPHRWALIYGSPVPGYRAPEDTIGPGARVLLLIGRILLAAHHAGRLAPGEPLTGRYADELARVTHALGPDTPVRVVAGTLMLFFQLCGAVSGELFGQLHNSVDEDRQGFFEYQMRSAATAAGLTR